MNQLPYILLKRVSQTTRQPETGWDPASQIETLQELLMEYQNRVAVVKTVIKKAKVLGQWSLSARKTSGLPSHSFPMWTPDYSSAGRTANPIAQK